MSPIITQGLGTIQRIPTMGYGVSLVVDFEVGRIEFFVKQPTVTYTSLLAEIDWSTGTRHAGTIDVGGG